MIVPQPEPEIVAEIEEENIEVDPAVVARAVEAATATLNRDNEEHVICGTVASNPGGVKVSKLRYIQNGSGFGMACC